MFGGTMTGAAPMSRSQKDVALAVGNVNHASGNNNKERLNGTGNR